MRIKNLLLIILVTLIVFLGILKFPLEAIIEGFGVTLKRAEHLSRIIKNVVIVSLAILVIKKLKSATLSGLSTQLKWNYKYLALIPMYLVMLGVLSLIGIDLTGTSAIDITLLFIAMLSVGFSEEFIFRGLLQSVFLKHFINHKNGIIWSIFLPALLFGLLHLLNLKLDNIAASISQVIYAFFIGAAFGAILLKTNKLIPLAIIHGLIDFVFSINTLVDQDAMAGELEVQDVMSAIGSILVVLPLFIAGLLIMRKISKKSVLEKIEMSTQE